MNILKSVLAHCAEHYDFSLSQFGVIDISRTITVEGSPQRGSELSVFTTGPLVLDYFSNFFFELCCWQRTVFNKLCCARYLVWFRTCFFLWLYIFWHVQIMKNHVFCYNFSCMNVCELRICHLLHLFVRYTMYHLLYWK